MPGTAHGSQASRSTAARLRSAAECESRTAQLRDLLLVLLLGLWVGTSLLLHGAEAHPGMLGAVATLMPGSFVLLAALRCGQIAFAKGKPRRLTLPDPILTLATIGWAAGLLLGPRLLAG